MTDEPNSGCRDLPASEGEPGQSAPSEKQLEDLESRLRVAVEALRFYADESNYDGWAPVEYLVDPDGEDLGCEYDKGRIARTALASVVPGQRRFEVRTPDLMTGYCFHCGQRRDAHDDETLACPAEQTA